MRYIVRIYRYSTIKPYIVSILATDGLFRCVEKVITSGTINCVKGNIIEIKCRCRTSIVDYMQNIVTIYSYTDWRISYAGGRISGIKLYK
jgi:hypothetical protein